MKGEGGYTVACAHTAMTNFQGTISVTTAIQFNVVTVKGRGNMKTKFSTREIDFWLMSMAMLCFIVSGGLMYMLFTL